MGCLGLYKTLKGSLAHLKILWRDYHILCYLKTDVQIQTQDWGTALGQEKKESLTTRNLDDTFSSIAHIDHPGCHILLRIIFEIKAAHLR